MQKKILTFMILVGLITTPRAALGKSPLDYFGYYWADSEAYGHYMDKVVIPADGTRLYDYTNVVQIVYESCANNDPRRAVIDAANLGYQIIFGGWDNLEPYPYNQAKWLQEAQIIDSYISGYEDHILCVYLMDEPESESGVWSRSRQESLVQAFRDYFQNRVKFAINYSDPVNYQIARNLDYVMFDFYLNWGGYTTPKSTFDSYWSAYVNTVKNQSPGTPIIPIGDSFKADPKLFPTLEQQQWYYDAAVAEPAVAGLIYFMLGNVSPQTYMGAISSPESLALHKTMGLTVKGQPAIPQVLDERFDNYTSQTQLGQVYIGVNPYLTSEKDHGGNGGKSVRFGPTARMEMGVRRTSSENLAGSVSAYLWNSTVASGDYFGFRALNNEGNFVVVYAQGGNPNYYIENWVNNVRVFQDNSLMPSLAHWQKIEFVFDGSGVKIYGDSTLIHETTTGWYGGFSQIGFYDPWNSPGKGYIDDINAFQVPTVPVQGTVTLGDFSTSPTGISVTIGIRNPGETSVVENHTVVLDAGGHYTFSTSRTGVYDLAAKASHWLRQKMPNVMITGTGATVNFNLINGDSDGNNLVTSTDLSILLAVMDALPTDINWNSSADLDGDQEITSTDLSVILANMDRTGDPYYKY